MDIKELEAIEVLYNADPFFILKGQISENIISIKISIDSAFDFSVFEILKGSRINLLDYETMIFEKLEMASFDIHSFINEDLADKEDRLIRLVKAYIQFRLGEKELNKKNFKEALDYYSAGLRCTTPRDNELLKRLSAKENEIKNNALKANNARWEGKVETKRRRYLELDRQKQSELGKQTTIKYTAMWIYNHHNEFDEEYETIQKHLSNARKGIFTN